MFNSARKIAKGIVVLSALLMGGQKASAQLFFGIPQPPQRQIRVPVGQNEVDFIYNVNFDYYFDNWEFNRSATPLAKSQTLHAARVTPELGFEIKQNRSITHRVKSGIDVMKYMGENPISTDEKTLQNSELFREITLYYQLNINSGKTRFQTLAGIFPRRYAEGSASRAFFSESKMFFDHNIEGFLFKVSQPKTYFELGLDWMGRYSMNRKERFITFGFGEYKPFDFFSTGIAMTYHHQASSVQAPGVVDNGLIEPYICLDITKYTSMDRLSAKLGYLQSFQNDREFVGEYVFPAGGELILDAGKWNFGIENTTYLGSSLMPYFNNLDASGNQYGEDLYLGDLLYRISVNPEDWKKVRAYDRVELYYRPHISSFMDLQVSAIVHFLDGYVGNQLKFTINLDLEKISSRGFPSLRQTKFTSSPKRRQNEQRQVPKGLQML